MTESLNVSPDDVRKSGADLGDVSSQFKQVLVSLQAKLAGYGQPWGDDSTGHQFADGPSGYVAQLNWVFGAINAKTDLLDDYSQSLTQAATAFEQQDNA